MTTWIKKRVVLEVECLVADGFSDADVNDYFQFMLDPESGMGLTSADVDLSAVREQRVRVREVAWWIEAEDRARKDPSAAKLAPVIQPRPPETTHATTDWRTPPAETAPDGDS